MLGSGAMVGVSVGSGLGGVGLGEGNLGAIVGRYGKGLDVLGIGTGTYGGLVVGYGVGLIVGPGGGIGLDGMGLGMGCGSGFKPHLITNASLHGYLGHFASGSKRRLSGHENFIAEFC